MITRWGIWAGQNLSFTWDLSVLSFPPCHKITRWGKPSVSPEIFLCFHLSQGERFGWVKPQFHLRFFFVFIYHKVRDLAG
jgi:hypothetical protein